MIASFVVLLLLVPWIAPPVATPLPAVSITDLSYDRASDDTDRPEAASRSEPPTGTPPRSLDFSASVLRNSRVGSRAEDAKGRMITTHDSRGPPAWRGHHASRPLPFPPPHPAVGPEYTGIPTRGPPPAHLARLVVRLDLRTPTLEVRMGMRAWVASLRPRPVDSSEWDRLLAARITWGAFKRLVDEVARDTDEIERIELDGSLDFAVERDLGRVVIRADG